ncbi:MAG: DUF2461 family protein [Acidobacteria bacterium]|nr:DUF2461 family protein [Acidobacteriota bacterium]
MAFSGFSPKTFKFLSDLEANNQKDWFSSHHLDFIKEVDQPLRALIKELEPFFLSHSSDLETSAKTGKTLSRINKNIFGHKETGLYNTSYWAAFYRKTYKKQTDLQLFLGLRPTGFQIGLYASHRAENLLTKFRNYIASNKTRFFSLIENLRFPINIFTEETLSQPLKIGSLDDLEFLNQGKCLAILRSFSSDDETLFSSNLLFRIEETFDSLLPLYKQIISDLSSPLEIDEVIEIEGDNEIEITYDVEDLKQETYLEEDFIKQIFNLLNHKKQIIFYGPSGTGKTFIAEHFAQYFINGKGEYKIIQFHPSYSYEDFIEGIRPETIPTQSGQSTLSYQVLDGLFKQFCQKARSGNKDSKFVLIIDEINRGNLTRIFGELLYLLEYRNNIIELPYSKKTFNIPPNLYIIGTMNIADRSIALVDHALRRRFHFISLNPDANVLRKFLREHAIEQVWIADLLVKLNQQLTSHGISREYHIGHSHFMSRNIDFTQLQLIWDFTILPTIEEFFYNRPDLLAKYSLAELSRGLIDQTLLSTLRT